jgi:hypothetical protein
MLVGRNTPSHSCSEKAEGLDASVARHEHKIDLQVFSKLIGYVYCLSGAQQS